jgi:hypothetical protein
MDLSATLDKIKAMSNVNHLSRFVSAKTWGEI